MENKELYTKKEVINLLKEMQEEALHTQGFVIGHVTQIWVVSELLGERIKKLGGEEVPYKVK